MTPFEKLSRSLTGSSLIDDRSKNSPRLKTEPEVQPRVIDPRPKNPEKLVGGVGGTPTGTLTIEYDGVAKTVRQWSKELGLPLATLRYRYLAGWTPAEILGLEPRPRDRTAEQATLTRSALVVVLDEYGRPMSRRAAAAILHVQPRSLARRLRSWRTPGQQNTVPVADLYTGSRLEALALTKLDK